MRWLGSIAIALSLTLVACEDDGLDALHGDAAPAAGVDATAGPRVDSGVLMDAAPLPMDANGLDIDRFDDAAAPGPDVSPLVDALPRDADPTACDGGVTSSSLSTNDSVATVTGLGPQSTVGQLTVTSTSGGLLQIPVSTDGNGAWSVDVPLFCGLQTIVVEFPGASCGPRTEITVQRTGCRSTDLQVTLSWDAVGLDFELHLIRAGGRINDNASDCTWTSCINSAPDWGVLGSSADDPHKDVDNTGTFGPENIYLSFPEPGPYTVMVEHWGGGGATADGEVTIQIAGQAPVVIPIVDLPSHFVRTVATIDWAGRAVTVVPTVHDCTGNWSGGCRDAIP